MIIDGVQVTTEGFNFDNPPPDHAELKNYVQLVKARVDDVIAIKVKASGKDFVDISYSARHQKFERIRRITGYLTGDLATWNNSKQAEERDRVKHMEAIK